MISVNKSICLPYFNINFLILNSYIIGSKYINESVINRTNKTIEINQKNIPFRNFSSILCEKSIDNKDFITNEYNALLFSTKILEKSKKFFPNDDFFSIITTSDSTVKEIYSNEFLLIKGQLGKLYQSNGITAIHFLQSKAEFLIDIDIFVEKLWSL